MKLNYTLLFLLINFICSAQKNTLKGVVVDASDTPLAQVYAFNRTSKTHSHTLTNGNFLLLDTKVGDTITFNLIGFENKKMLVKESDFNTTLKIGLLSQPFNLNEIILNQEKNPLNIVTKLDLETNPVNSSQEILRKVPGLFIGQHAGGGKAEQLFLRGFDIDHGTDISITVDNIPVNMVSHAHGQGYADLHFLIPETIDKVDFDKGPYYASQGNFNTAGYVDFTTKEKFESNVLKLGIGDFNTHRTLGLFNILGNSTKNKATLALEYLESDGAFDAPQNFNRINLSSKYTTYTAEGTKINVAASYFKSRWDASGQIPQRSVDKGSISRFGAIDDTEGGTTSRTNLSVSFNKFISEKTTLEATTFYSNYDFELYSNFTFFLNDPINGDQIKQKERRDLVGFKSVLNSKLMIGNADLDINIGTGLRYDQVNGNELSRTLNRKTTLQNISLGNVNETNIYTYAEALFEYNNLKINPVLRLDYFKNSYEDQLAETYELGAKKSIIVTPKVSFLYDYTSNLNLYLKTGFGFHSNDTRVVVVENSNTTLPKAFGADLGVNWKPASNIFINTALWLLDLEQEFVYVGDEGVVEPSGSTIRYGLDLTARYQFNSWLFFDSDFTYTKAKFKDASDGFDYIPLAPEFTAAGGLAIKKLKNFSGGLRCRFLGDRAATEDKSSIAKGYTIFDANVNYSIKNVTLGVAIENLFNVAWNETQFFTESKLFDETIPVEEIHFTPGTPFFVKGTVAYQF